GWVAALDGRFAEGYDVVQGRTLPDPAGAPTAGPWDRTIRIERQTPLFETCNIGYRRSSFETAGGFDDLDALTDRRRGQPFGDDGLPGGGVGGAGGAATFAPEALVFHRYHRATYRDWLAGRRRLVDLPALGRRSGVVAGAFWHGIFLSRESAA